MTLRQDLSHRRNMPTADLRVTTVLDIVNVLAFSRTRGFCARGFRAYFLSARCAIAAERRRRLRRLRRLRGSLAARPLRLGLGRVRRRSWRRRASPTRSPITCASSGWANPRVVAPSKYPNYPSSTTRNSFNRFASASGTRATSRVPSSSCSTRSTVPVRCTSSTRSPRAKGTRQSTRLF